MDSKRFFIFFFILSCSSVKTDDPLKNTKKLVKEGHANLYQNGAFQVPSTSIKLIPEGPQMWDLAYQWSGPLAKKSFTLAIGRAAESVVVVAEGTKKSFQFAGKINNESEKLAQSIKQSLKKDSILIMNNSKELSSMIIGTSWSEAKKISDKMNNLNEEQLQIGLSQIKQDYNELSRLSTATDEQGKEIAKEISQKSSERTAEDVRAAYQDVIKGIVTYPNQVNSRQEEIKLNESLKQFSNHYSDTSKYRSEWSDQFKNDFNSTLSEAKKDTSQSFSNAAKNFDQSANTGISLAALKAVTDVLEGLFWHATVRPIGKLTYNGLGYLVSNTIAFPVILTFQAGVETSWLAIKIGWNSSLMAYDLVGPTVKLSLIAALSLTRYSGEQLAAGGVVVGTTIASATTKATAETYKTLGTGAVYFANGLVKYVGVPLTYAGIVAGGTTIGVGIGAGGYATSGATYVGSEVASAGTYGGGKILAGSTVVGGAVASTIAGSGLAIYEVGKSIVVPSSQVLGAGVVLTYGNLVHLGAHTVLGVSDAAYLVLSMEGPNAVIYAVKGVVGKNSDLPEGTLINLEELRKKGDVIYQVPASNKEVEKVLESFEK